MGTSDVLFRVPPIFQRNKFIRFCSWCCFLTLIFCFIIIFTRERCNIPSTIFSSFLQIFLNLIILLLLNNSIILLFKSFHKFLERWNCFIWHIRTLHIKAAWKQHIIFHHLFLLIFKFLIQFKHFLPSFFHILFFQHNLIVLISVS